MNAIQDPRLRVRAATGGDLDFLVQANLALARETEDTQLDEAVLTRGVRRALDDEGRGLYFVATEDEGTDSTDASTPAGSLMVTREWSDWRDGWIWWIQSVYVRPQRRRTGVYRCLHAAVLDAAHRRGDVRLVRLYVDEHNHGARATYEALGMHLGRYDLMEQSLPKNGEHRAGESSAD